MTPAVFQSAIMLGTPLLYGATGEILTEKSGNLNLGIPGIMYIGGISGVLGAFLYQNAHSVPGKPFTPNPVLGVLVPLVCCLLGSLLASMIYSFLTITLRANQNVTGLALTTFGVGLGNFIGGSLIKLVKTDMPFIALTRFAKLYQKTGVTSKSAFATIFLRHGFLVYVALIIALVVYVVLYRTRVGLHLRAVGENPATADAAGINVTRCKYLATCIGGMIAGLGGLYYVMDYSSGIWSNNAFGDLGWLAIALVIFAVWKPQLAIPGSYLFGFLYVLYNFLNIPMRMQPLVKMLPYVVTILVLLLISARKKRETQPPQSLGLSYFREDR